jgi:hypothetical protein
MSVVLFTDHNIIHVYTSDIPGFTLFFDEVHFAPARLKNISVCPNPTHHSEVWVGR